MEKRRTKNKKRICSDVSANSLGLVTSKSHHHVRETTFSAVHVSAGISQKTHVQTYFPHMLPVAVSWCSSDDSAVCYLLPVLQMTSCFHKTGKHRQCNSMYTQTDSLGCSIDSTWLQMWHMLSTGSMAAKSHVYN